MKKSNNNLISTLRLRYRNFQWCGREQESAYLGHKGAYVTYTAHINGFEIQISVHDYRGPNFPHGVPTGVRWRRKNLPINVRQWIEVSVKDGLTRFGRRSILDRKVFLPGTAEYDELRKIFGKIREIGIFFKPSKTDRLSSDAALRQFCKNIIAKGSS